MSLTLFLMTEKGQAVLEGVIASVGPGAVSLVVGARDANVRNDRYEDIRAACRKAGIAFADRVPAPAIATDYALAVSWRWMIHGVPNLIALHDSLLPKYRGFAPLPNALINGEREVGVSALFASDDYDRGDIVCQRRLQIEYPIKIRQAIQSVIPLYVGIASEICSSLASGAQLPRGKQDEAEATYSLWRDDLDYEIDWRWDAARIARFIDAVGYPYLGARTTLNREPVTVHDAVAEPDVRIEDRAVGKVIFVRGGQPVVVCGSGLLRIARMETPEGRSLLPLKKFRSRLGAAYPVSRTPGAP
jgi:methionyl-tRNA formyltransferase